MNIIFLDIDGVLNNQIFFEHRHKHPYSSSSGISEDRQDIDPRNIEELNTLCAFTNAKVVISSTWRRGMTVEQLQELFKECEFTGEIIDKTPALSYYDSTDAVPRGAEIHKWVRDTGYVTRVHGKYKNYVILDDDSDMLYNQRNNFLWVDPYAGLTPNLVYKAKQMLLDTED